MKHERTFCEILPHLHRQLKIRSTSTEVPIKYMVAEALINYYNFEDLPPVEDAAQQVIDYDKVEARR